MLSRLWSGFFLVSMLAALWRWLVGGDPGVFAAMVTDMLGMAKTAVDLGLLLLGTMSLWLGMLRIAERSGLVEHLGRLLAPLLLRLMPEVPRGHPALGLVSLSIAANMLGLDNAATPIGLRAMRELQTLNPSREVASNAQILFMVLHASALSLLPVSIFMYRAQQGAHDPALVFLPILLATAAAALAGLFSVLWVQRIRVLDPVLLAWLGGGIVALAALMALLAALPVGALGPASSLAGNLMLLAFIALFLLAGAWKKVPLLDAFLDGAKEAWDLVRDLLPYLVAMLCAVALLRASGALDLVLEGVRALVHGAGLRDDWVAALPTALLRPFSASASRAMLIETMQHSGVDSFPALLAATIQGSSETTFYVVAVYFGAIGIRQVRHAIACALIADLAGLLASIAVCSWFFGGR